MSGIYNGTIRFVNVRSGVAAIELTENGLFSVVELKGSEVGIGDEIVGNLGIQGDVDLFNRTRRDRINGFVRHSGLAREDAIRALKSADSQMSQG